MKDDMFALAQTVDDRTSHPTLISQDPIDTSSGPTVLPRVEVVDGTATFVPSTLPRFSVKESLGAGGVGEVFRVHDADIGRDVAIKRLRSDRTSSTAVARFVEEMRVTGGLDHPNVVPVHDVGVNDDGDFFFVMRHVRGETLEAIIERLAADDPETHRRFSFERRVQIFKSVLEAIAYAHSRGVIHRDIKPANIMVGPFGEVVVMDWGVAKPLANPTDLAVLDGAPAASESEGLERAFCTQAGALVGTPAYMAPEQVRGMTVDERTDIYALSVLFHEMLFLRHYLPDAKTLVQLCNDVVNTSIGHSMTTPSKIQGSVPADLLWFVEMGMRKEPERRFQTVAEMIERLERREAGEIKVQCHLTFTRRMFYELIKALDRDPLVSTIVVIGGALAIVGALFWAIMA